MTVPFVSRRQLLMRSAAVAATGVLLSPAEAFTAALPAKAEVLAAMKRASAYMTDKLAVKGGGYLWYYAADLSRRWGEMEATNLTTIWLQSPSTPLMGNVFLDAYHATGDDYYYQTACKVGDVIVAAQLDCGGWHYRHDFAGAEANRKWYDTVAKNGWRLEEFQHFYGNATFDDSTSSDVLQFLLRLYVEKNEPRFKPALDKGIQFVLDSQYACGGWPQRFPLRDEFHHHGLPDYTSFITFNDDVVAHNVQFLVMVWQTLGDKRVLEPIRRGMNCYVVTQQPQPQPAWGLQHTASDLKPASARTYEPKALVTHTSAANIDQMMDFYEMTGDAKFMARLPEAMDWIESVKLPPEIAEARGDYPTFLEVGTNKPMFVHRRGSDVVNGEYYVDYDHAHTIRHYSSFRHIDLVGLRARYTRLKATPVAVLEKNSPLLSGRQSLPRFFASREIELRDLWAGAGSQKVAPTAAEVSSIVQSLDGEGRWLAPLRMTSHPYMRDGYATPVPGDFSQAMVGDDTDTSPFPNPDPIQGVSTAHFVSNLSTLLHHVAAA